MWQNCIQKFESVTKKNWLVNMKNGYKVIATEMRSANHMKLVEDLYLKSECQRQSDSSIFCSLSNCELNDLQMWSEIFR